MTKLKAGMIVHIKTTYIHAVIDDEYLYNNDPLSIKV